MKAHVDQAFDPENPKSQQNAIHREEGAIDIDQVITTPPVNQEEHDEIVAELNADGVNAGDMDEVIAVPIDHQEADVNIFAGAEQLLETEANNVLPDPFPVLSNSDESDPENLEN